MGKQDKARNKINETKGEAKEWVGKHTDNSSLANEGRADQAKANARQAGEHVKDAAHDAAEHVRDAADDAKDAVRRDR